MAEKNNQAPPAPESSLPLESSSEPEKNNRSFLFNTFWKPFTYLNLSGSLIFLFIFLAFREGKVLRVFPAWLSLTGTVAFTLLFLIAAWLDWKYNRNRVYDPIWKFLSKVHIAIITLIILASISIIGTILSQGESEADNLRLFQNAAFKVFIKLGMVEQSSPASVAEYTKRSGLAAARLHRFSKAAGFTNLYHTWYFHFLLGFLTLNILVCSLRRWPQTWRLLAHPPLELDESGFKGSPFRCSLALKASRDAAGEAVHAALKRAGYAPRITRRREADSFFGSKGAYSRLGVYCTHLSIIIIFLGGIIGALNGFKGHMQITEGTSERRVVLRDGRGRLILPFEVRCDDFEVVFYEGSSRPKDFYSTLTILKGGVEQASKRIEVNHPLKYEGIYFYQSSYGETGRGLTSTLLVTDPKTGIARTEQFESRPRELPDFNLTLQVVQVIPDFAMDSGRGVYSKSNQPNNPAALVRVELPDGSSRTTWLLANYPEPRQIKDLPVDLTFLNFTSLQYTGLQVVYDPGVWVIWTGCTLMVLGLIFAFFISHRRVWVRLEGEGATVRVRLAGAANKNREAFGEEFRRLGERISNNQR